MFHPPSIYHALELNLQMRYSDFFFLPVSLMSSIFIFILELLVYPHDLEESRNGPCPGRISRLLAGIERCLSDDSKSNQLFFLKKRISMSIAQ